MSTVTVSRWGRDFGVRLPLGIARAVGLDVGTQVDIIAVGGELVLRPIVKPLTLEGLFAGKTDQEWRSLYGGSEVDWGPDLGRENVDE